MAGDPGGLCPIFATDSVDWVHLPLQRCRSVDSFLIISKRPPISFDPNAQPIMISSNFPSDGRREIARFGSEPLLALPDGRFIDLASGYIPLLAQFTFEDKAAKGLRKRKAGQKPEPPIHFSALELVCDHRFLLLTGPSGSGKTTFAKYLCFQLTTGGFQKPRAVIRNELGHVREETWLLGETLPYFFVVVSAQSLRDLVEVTVPKILEAASKKQNPEEGGTLIVLDGIENAGDQAAGLLTVLTTRIKASGYARLLVLGETSTCRHWSLPSDIARHELLPLLVSQRKIAISELLGAEKPVAQIGTGAAAANPALFALAIQSQDPGDTGEHVLDTWLSVASADLISAESLPEQAYHQLSDRFSSEPKDKGLSSDLDRNPLLRCNAVKYLLAARHLVRLDQDAIIELFRQHPRTTQPVIRSCLSRLSSSDQAVALVEGLLHGPSSGARHAAFIVADFAEASSRFTDRIKELAVNIVLHGDLTASEREKAGRILSRLGDPRDLEALAVVPAGVFTMGSTSHPKSQPVHTIIVPSFRMSVYPVVNKHYMAFVQDTDREWLSPDGADPERENAPATDLTWHDARAYCAWLTTRWRATGKIGAEEQVRLPTEPEWERAARGDYTETGSDDLVYPWGTTWQDDAANSEEAGFNNTCAVGIFPKGRSPYGCYDMAGHVWEWCTTLWGEDMATPSYSYPWRVDDGREALDAPEQVRRVLRGGCFSSPKVKANCTYRGSLEPSGFWRGNGFRIVVSRA